MGAMPETTDAITHAYGLKSHTEMVNKDLNPVNFSLPLSSLADENSVTGGFLKTGALKIRG